MTRDHAEALAALFDHERVDPAAVESALADPEAPTLLVELAELRALAQQEIGRPDDAFYVAMAPLLRPRRVNRWWRWVVQPAMAASLLLLAGLTGYYIRPAPTPPRQNTAQPARPGGPEAQVPTGETPARGREVAAAPAASPPARGREVAAAPAASPPAGPNAPAGGPPPASLRLRFAQWQVRGATASGQPE